MDSPQPPLDALPTVAITGASGALGQALLKQWHRQGANLVALRSGSAPLELADAQGQAIPLRQICWQVGEEEALGPLLADVDVLVINHGVNVHGQRSAAATWESLQVNALSCWRLLELYAAVTAGRSAQEQAERPRPEVWVNTSEAEIQLAVSPLYEISKRLLGQLLSLRALDLTPRLRIRRLVLGPFRSALNPIGLMQPGFVAAQIMRQARLDWGLIIVTPNPITYVLMPLATVGRWLYFQACSRGPGQELRSRGQ